MIEKEKKFKVIGIPTGDTSHIKQTYLLLSKTSHLRVRIINQKAILTFKCGSSQIRDEFEWEIPLQDGIKLSESTKVSLSKTRTSEKYNWCHIDVDDYGDGKIVGEVEYDEVLSKPDYLGDELDNEEYEKFSNIRIAQENNATGLILTEHEMIHNLIEFDEYKIIETIHKVFVSVPSVAVVGEGAQIWNIINNTPYSFCINSHVKSVVPVWKINNKSHSLTFSYIHSGVFRGSGFNCIIVIGYSRWSETNKSIWNEDIRASHLVMSRILYIEY